VVAVVVERLLSCCCCCCCCRVMCRYWGCFCSVRGGTRAVTNLHSAFCPVAAGECVAI